MVGRQFSGYFYFFSPDGFYKLSDLLCFSSFAATSARGLQASEISVRKCREIEIALRWQIHVIAWKERFSYFYFIVKCHFWESVEN